MFQFSEYGVEVKIIFRKYPREALVCNWAISGEVLSLDFVHLKNVVGENADADETQNGISRLLAVESAFVNHFEED